MNPESPLQKARLAANVLAILGTLLVMAFLVWLMRYYTAAPSIAADRAAERLKILADFNAANAPLVEKYDWQDKDKGIVRVPLARAKELVLTEWQHPAAAHSNLMARAATAFAPPPKPPPVKNEYE
jgi:Fe2+ transport system protein B